MHKIYKKPTQHGHAAPNAAVEQATSSKCTESLNHLVKANSMHQSLYQQGLDHLGNDQTPPHADDEALQNCALKEPQSNQ